MRILKIGLLWVHWFDILITTVIFFSFQDSLKCIVRLCVMMLVVPIHASHYWKRLAGLTTLEYSKVFAVSHHNIVPFLQVVVELLYWCFNSKQNDLSEMTFFRALKVTIALLFLCSSEANAFSYASEFFQLFHSFIGDYSIRNVVKKLPKCA